MNWQMTLNSKRVWLVGITPDSEMALLVFSMDKMLEGSVPEDVASWIKDRLEHFKSTSGHGSLEIVIQDGYPITYRDTYSHKVSGRSRIRTRASR